MPRFKILLVALAAMFATLSCSEKADDQKGAAKEVQLDITLDKYYNSQGEHTTRTWAKTDKVALMNMSATTKKSQTASPATEGAASSKFSFTFEGANNGDQLLAYTPATANVRINSGKINLTLNEKQTGTVEKPFYIGKGSFSESGASIKLGNPYATLVANLKQGEYTIKKAVLKTNGGEKIAGTIALEYDTMELTGNTNSVTVEFNNGLDCRNKAQTFVFQLAPVTMANGYTITFITDSGSFTYKKDGSVTCTAGGKVDTEPIEGVSETSLLLCGDSMIYLIDPIIAMNDGYKKAILWEWDAKAEMATIGKDMLRLDDCKPVDNKSKILASSSRGYAVLLDFNTKKLLWYSNVSVQAHSIEYLPNNRIAVACSTGGDCVQIFDVNGSNQVLYSTALASAHGVVWNPATERLYAVGKTSLNIYTLTDWNTSSPKLTLEKTVNTKSYVTSLHDLTLVDEKTLLLAGKKAAFFDIETEKFTNLPHFSSATALKSVNYNPDTGECWYTDPSGSDRDLEWASNDIRYTSNINTSGYERNIWIGDLNMYKVRVFNW